MWNKKELPEEWKDSIIVPIYKKGSKTDFSNYGSILLLSARCKILSIILLSMLIPYAEEIIGVNSVDFDATDQLLIIRFAFAKYLRQNGNTMKQCVSYL